MIDNIISAYLRSNKRLVVPGLGSFIRKEGGEMVFVEFLKKDDGVLAGLVANDYGLGADEAAEVMAGYVEGVQRAVASSGRYVIDGVGVISADANGLLVLEGVDRPAEKVVFEVAVEEKITMLEPEPRREQVQEHVREQQPLSVPEPARAVEAVRMPEPEPVSEPLSVIEPEPARAVEAVRMPEPEPIVFRETARELGRSQEPFCGQEQPQEPFRAPEPVIENETELPGKKTFTLNDLYAAPGDEDCGAVERHDFWQRADSSGSESGDEWFGASAHDHEPARREEPLHGGHQHAHAQHRAATHAPHTSHATHAKHTPAEHREDEGMSAIRPPQIRRPVRRPVRPPRSRTDIVMIIAIVAAVLALGSLVWSFSRNKVSVRQSTEQTSVDSPGVEIGVQESTMEATPGAE